MTEDKLNFLQHQHSLRHLVPGDPVFDKTVDELVIRIESGDPISSSQSVLDRTQLRDYVSEVLRIDAKNYTTPHDFLIEHEYFFADFTPSFSPPEESKELLQQVFENSFITDEWNAAAVHECIADGANVIVETRLGEDPDQTRQSAEKKAKKDLYKHLRTALADGKPGPAIADMMEVLGRDECVQRMMNYVSD